jgi:hypothetical protein
MEYGFMIQTLDISPDMEDATADELSQDMAVRLNKVIQAAGTGLGNLPGSRKGEFISHNITRVGSHLVVSLLFKR